MNREFDHKPGSPEAVAQGCTCPPQAGLDPVFDPNCPLHAAADLVAPALPEQDQPEA